MALNLRFVRYPAAQTAVQPQRPGMGAGPILGEETQGPDDPGEVQHLPLRGLQRASDRLTVEVADGECGVPARPGPDPGAGTGVVRGMHGVSR